MVEKKDEVEDDDEEKKEMEEKRKKRKEGRDRKEVQGQSDSNETLVCRTTHVKKTFEHSKCDCSREKVEKEVSMSTDYKKLLEF